MYFKNCLLQMKIAYLSTFYPYRGGIAQFNALLYNELKSGHEVIPYTFTLQYPPLLFPGKTQMVQKGDNAEKIDSIRILSTINPLSFKKSVKIINEYNPDIFLTKFWMPYFAPSLGYVAGKLTKAKRISILDNVIPHELRHGDMTFINYFLERNDGFVVMSESVKKDLLQLKPDAKYIMVQHPLYNHFGEKINKREARAELALPQDKKIILCFGFIRDYKGIDLALESLRYLDDSYHLLIAGEVYGSFDKYRNIIKEHKLSKRVTLYTRYISDDETPLFFSAADCNLLPYKSATQSGIVAIAYHFDLPVIATKVGGLSEMIEPYGSGVMVDELSARGISDTIKNFFASHYSNYTANIANYKLIASWKSLSDNIISFAEELQRT